MATDGAQASLILSPDGATLEGTDGTVGQTAYGKMNPDTAADCLNHYIATHNEGDPPDPEAPAGAPAGAPSGEPAQAPAAATSPTNESASPATSANLKDSSPSSSKQQLKSTSAPAAAAAANNEDKKTKGSPNPAKKSPKTGRASPNPNRETEKEDRGGAAGGTDAKKKSKFPKNLMNKFFGGKDDKKKSDQKEEKSKLLSKGKKSALPSDLKLHEFLDNPRYKDRRNDFMDILLEQYCAENLLFYDEVEEYEKNYGEDLEKSKRHAQHIFENFIRSGAPRQLNLTHKVLDRTIKNMDDIAKDSFDDAKSCILQLMQNDCWNRFKDRYSSSQSKE